MFQPVRQQWLAVPTSVVPPWPSTWAWRPACSLRWPMATAAFDHALAGVVGGRWRIGGRIWVAGWVAGLAAGWPHGGRLNPAGGNDRRSNPDPCVLPFGPNGNLVVSWRLVLIERHASRGTGQLPEARVHAGLGSRTSAESCAAQRQRREFSEPGCWPGAWEQAGSSGAAEVAGAPASDARVVGGASIPGLTIGALPTSPARDDAFRQGTLTVECAVPALPAPHRVAGSPGPQPAQRA